MKKIIPVSILVLLLSLSAQGVLALSPQDRNAVNRGTVYYDPDYRAETLACTGLSDELDGHRLPATKGGAAQEQHLRVLGVDPEKPTDGDLPEHVDRTEDTRDPSLSRDSLISAGWAYKGNNPSQGVGAGALPTDEPVEEQWYINMRWRYALWAWDGSSKSGPEDKGFYEQNPKVLVTNPRTNKSVVASVIEAGPAPWTGTSNDKNNPPSYWQGYVDGTPPEYNGRVAGLSPEAYQYLGVAIRTADGNGDDLLYSWADQSANLGPSENHISDSGGCSASGADIIKNVVFPELTTEIDPTAIVLHWTGGTRGVEGTISTLKSRGLSVQLMIDSDGKVWQLTDPLHVLAAHAAGINSSAIGIEIGSGSHHGDYDLIEQELINNEVQYEAVLQTVMYLVQTYEISLEHDIEAKQGILGHLETDAASYGPGSGKGDPGPNYLERIRNEVNLRLSQ